MKTKLLLLALFIRGITFSQAIDLKLFANGFDSPTEIVHANDDQLFVVEQTGYVKILNLHRTVNVTCFLDVANLISTGAECGLFELVSIFTINSQLVLEQELG